MRYEDISPVLRDFLGYYQCLRNLGFSSDDIFLHYAKNRAGVRSVFLSMTTQRKSYSIELGPCERAEGETLTAEYIRVCKAIGSKDLSVEVLKRIYRESSAFGSMPFIKSLLDRGFFIPNE